jgi:hypothetical protein
MMDTPTPGNTYVEKIYAFIQPHLPLIVVCLLLYQYFISMPNTATEISTAQKETKEALLKVKVAESLLREQGIIIDALQNQVSILQFVTENSLLRINDIDRNFHAQADTTHANMLKRSESIKKQLR